MLLRHHFDWLVVAVVAVALSPSAIGQAWRRASHGHPHALLLVAGWATATWIVPTVLPTRLAWYLVPFYPGAAVLTALAVQETWRHMREHGCPGRANALCALVVLAAGVAEGRMIHRSFARVDLGRSAQGLLITFGDAVRGGRVFATSCPSPETFLIAAAGGTCVVVPDADEARRQARPGDLWIDSAAAVVPDFTTLGRNQRASLHQQPRRDSLRDLRAEP